MSRVIEEVDVVREPLRRLDAEQVDRVGAAERADAHRGARGAVILGAVEEMDLALPSVVHADERAFTVNGPRDRMALDAEVRLHIADERERILADAVALVDE